MLKIDESIFEAFLRGETQVFTFIFKEYSTKIYKRVYFLLKDEEDSLEVVQNLFVKLWERKGTLGINSSNFENYLYRMATSMSVDYLRKGIRKQRAISELLYEGHFEDRSVEDAYLSKEADEILESAINQLPPQRKLIFTLCRLEGKSYAEVSEMLSISVSTVSNQLVSASKSVRKYTEKYNHVVKMSFVLFFF